MHPSKCGSEKKPSKHHETGNISPLTPLFWEYLKTSEREQICVKVKTYFPEQRRSVWPLIPRADFKSHGLTLIGEEQHLPRAMTIDGFSRDVGLANQKLQHVLVAILCDLMWIYWALTWSACQDLELSFCAFYVIFCLLVSGKILILWMTPIIPLLKAFSKKAGLELNSIFNHSLI